MFPLTEKYTTCQLGDKRIQDGAQKRKLFVNEVEEKIILWEVKNCRKQFQICMEKERQRLSGMIKE